MYFADFVVAVLVDGKTAKEENGTFTQVKIPFGREYAIRLKNKMNTPIGVDLYIDGKLVNKLGPLFVDKNHYLDVDRWIIDEKETRKLVFEKITHPEIDGNDSEVGLVEARFYKPKEDFKLSWSPVIIEKHIYPYYPVWPWWEWRNTQVPYTQPMWTISDKPTYTNTWADASPHITCSDSSTIITTGGTVHGPIIVDNTKFNVNTEKLQLEPVVLKLQLTGYDVQVEICGCGHMFTYEKYCPMCGDKK